MRGPYLGGQEVVEPRGYAAVGNVQQKTGERAAKVTPPITDLH